jgi:mannose-6-phosphate isomerase-like protein (cupin superfamily)
VSPALEYQSLREEMLVAKKYVFERPLLILALGAAALAGGNETHITFLPVLMSGLLVFNLWFTVNRLRSAARIAAYVQWELEERKAKHWVGWETALRRYRIWLKRTDKKKRNELIAEHLEADAVPDALMYYPAIYRLHLGLLVILLAGSVAAFVVSRSFLSFICLVATIALSVILCFYLARWAPKDLTDLIERNRVIWKIVLEIKQLPALLIRRDAVERDPALASGERGDRKLLVTRIYEATEQAATEIEWKPPPPGKKCGVQLMQDAEMAVFTESASQDRHYHIDATEVYSVVEGEMLIEVDGIDYHLTEGDTIVVNPGVVHEVKPEGHRFLGRVIAINQVGGAGKVKVE